MTVREAMTAMHGAASGGARYDTVVAPLRAAGLNRLVVAKTVQDAISAGHLRMDPRTLLVHAGKPVPQ